MEPRDAGKWRREIHDWGPANWTGESDGADSASTSRQSPRPLVVGATLGLDGAHADPARTKRAGDRMVPALGQVIAADNLQAAYWAVWRNGGAPGVDGQTDGPTDGLRRMGCLVWNTAHVPMVSLVEKPLTGEPDAGNPPVRFGGRGGANPAIPTPMNNVGITPRLRNLFLHEPQGHWPHPCPSPQDLRARCGLNDQ